MPVRPSENSIGIHGSGDAMAKAMIDNSDDIGKQQKMDKRMKMYTDLCVVFTEESGVAVPNKHSCRSLCPDSTRED